MVIGNGLLASSFSEYKNDEHVLIFASGVSNSKSSSAEGFEREDTLLRSAIKNHPKKKIVYFSTCSIGDPDLKNMPYVQHKISMENLLENSDIKYNIFRLSNVVGMSNNPNTVINFFYFHIVKGISFDLWKHSYRNIIDVEDVYKIADAIIKNSILNNSTVNIANKVSYPITQIIESIEKHTNKKAIAIEKDKGGRFEIDINAIETVCNELDIQFDEHYLDRLLTKYFHSK